MSANELEEYSTRDVSLAAFIRYKGYDIIRFRRVGRRKIGEWTFRVPETVVDDLKNEYINGDFAAFEGIRRGLSKQKY